MASAKQWKERRARGVCVICEAETQGAKCETCLQYDRVLAKQRRELRLAAGKCQICGKRPRVSGSIRCTICKEKHARHGAKSRKQRHQLGVCASCGKPRDQEDRTTCSACRKKKQARYAGHREAVFDYYGRRCKCCGEDNMAFLQMDHINNDGYKHRREIGQSGLYRWLVKNDFPEGFQTLCANCNFAKKSGECPHQRQSAITLKLTEEIA